MSTTEPDVEITVRLHGQTKTFTASATTTGNRRAAVVGLVNAVTEDVRAWTREVEEARPVRPRLMGRLR